jgi:thioredoxin 1
VNRLTIIFAVLHFKEMAIKIQTREELQGLTNSLETILLYFYNDDCAPCLSLRPKVEQLLTGNFPKINLVYVNAKEHPELMSDYGVYSFPVIIFIVEGKEFIRYSKYVSMPELSEAIGRIYQMYYSS